MRLLRPLLYQDRTPAEARAQSYQREAVPLQPLRKGVQSTVTHPLLSAALAVRRSFADPLPLTSDTLLRHWKSHSLGGDPPNKGMSQVPTMDDARSLPAFPTGVDGEGIAMTPTASTVDLNDQTSGTNSHQSLQSLQSHQSPTGRRTNSNASLNGTSSHGPSQSHDMVASVGYSIHDNISGSSRAPERALFGQDVTVQGQGQQTQIMPGDFSIPLADHNHVSPLSNDNLWGASIMSPGPSWLIGYDFDLEALNSASTVPATMEMGEPLFQPHIPFTVMPNIPEPDPSRRAGMQRKQWPINDVVKKSWFSQTEDMEDEEDGHRAAATGQTTPAIGANQYDVDDNFRTRVSLRLKPRTNDDPLPSNNFLNLSVQMYFTKFNTVFPVIHGQTFRPTPKNSLLLLSICSVGSLLIGSKGAAAQGVRIFERLNKAILASWETTVLSDPSEASSMIQAALIGQTFGLLSGDAKHLAIVEAFHGTVVAWARRCNMFRYRRDIPQVDGLTGSELDHAWKAWARSEETVRSVVIYPWLLQRLLTDHVPGPCLVFIYTTRNLRVCSIMSLSFVTMLLWYPPPQMTACSTHLLQVLGVIKRGFKHVQDHLSMKSSMRTCVFTTVPLRSLMSLSAKVAASLPM